MIVVVPSLVSTLSQALRPLFLGDAVQELTRAVSNVAKRSHDLSSSYRFLGLMVSVYAAGIIASLIAWMVVSKFTASVTNDMKEDLFTRFQRILAQYFDTRQDGKLLSLFSSDLDDIFNTLNNATLKIISQDAPLIGTIIMVFIVSPTMAWFTMATTPFILIVSLVIMEKTWIYLDKQQGKISDLNDYINGRTNGGKVTVTNDL